MSCPRDTVGGSVDHPTPTTAAITETGMILDGRPVSNAGTINMASGGYMYMQNNAVLTNSGTIDFESGGSLDHNGTAGTTLLINRGTIKKSVGTSGSNFTVPLTMQSGSQIQVLA